MITNYFCETLGIPITWVELHKSCKGDLKRMLKTIDSGMYNITIKKGYLERYDNNDTQEVYGRIFKKSALKEKEYEKDLCDFSGEQLKVFVKQILQPKTKESLRSIYSTISYYIDWAIAAGITKRVSNPWEHRDQEYIYSLVHQVKNYMNYDEKQFMLSKLINAQDKFIIEALWNGIQGDKLNELVKLKIDRIEQSTRMIIDDELLIVRMITAFDDQLSEYAILANQQKLYIKKNGESSEKTISESAELVESNYIIKRSNTKHKGEKTYTTHYTVYNRIEMFRELEAMKPFFNVLVTKNIVRSGMIYFALQLLKRDGKLERTQIEEVCERFNVHFKWSMKDFINLETLKELYPNDIMNA